MTSARRARSDPPPRRHPSIKARSADVHHEPCCRLVFVLAEGLRHIGDRRAREVRRRGTMRVLRPARQTDQTMPPPRTRTRTRTRRQRDPIAP